MAIEREPDAPRSPPTVGTTKRMYRVAWLTVCAAIGAVGVAVLLILSPAAFAILFPVFALVGVTLVLAGAGEHSSLPGRSRARRALVGALAAGTVASAYVGLAAVLGAGVLLLIVIVAASAPSAMSVYARWLRVALAPSTGSIAAWAPGFVSPVPGWAPPQLRPDLDLLSTEELCRAWCASYLVLKERYSERETRATLATVEERQRYLDELERRNASGFTAWLASNARVASNPLPYLVENRTERPVINWDELT